MSPVAKYHEIGLVNTKEMFKRAMTSGYAVPAYNFNNMEQIQAIVSGCAKSGSPVILQVSGSARKYGNATMLPFMVQGAVEMIRAEGSGIPVALHLDHGSSFDLAKSCIESGFSSVMIDGSHLSFDDNIELTRQVVDYAHDYDVTVEAELGVLAGVEDEVSSAVSHYTKPEEVEAFVGKTGVDSLAISIGTSHGAFKFKLVPGEEPPPLRFDILEEVEKRLPGFPIVLHGASSVVPAYVSTINSHGGALKDKGAHAPRPRHRVTQRDAAALGHTEHVRRLDAQLVEQHVDIVNFPDEVRWCISLAEAAAVVAQQRQLVPESGDLRVEYAMVERPAVNHEQGRAVARHLGVEMPARHRDPEPGLRMLRCRGFSLHSQRPTAPPPTSRALQGCSSLHTGGRPVLRIGQSARCRALVPMAHRLRPGPPQ